MRSTFAVRVLAVVRAIPSGRVATYGDVARLAGRARASRAVGNIMRGCDDPSVPCHRVVAAGGRLGGYGGDDTLKAHLLAAEGVVVAGRRIRGFPRARWPGRQTPRQDGSRRTPAAGRSAHVPERPGSRSPGERPTGNARTRGSRLR